jgi:hypothetical protein
LKEKLPCNWFFLPLQVLKKLLLDPTRRPDTVGELIAAVSAEEAALPVAPVDPEAVYTMGEELGFEVQLMWQPGQPSTFDALFVRAGRPRGDYLPLAMATYEAAGAVPESTASPSFWEAFTNKSGNYGEYAVTFIRCELENTSCGRSKKRLRNSRQSS